MSAHTITPFHGASATGLGAFPRQSYSVGVGDAMRAVRVFVATAFDVAIFGEYAEEAGLRRGVFPSPRPPHGD